jgi:hypothetical protein
MMGSCPLVVPIATSQGPAAQDVRSYTLCLVVIGVVGKVGADRLRQRGVPVPVEPLGKQAKALLVQNRNIEVANVSTSYVRVLHN